MSRTLSVTVDLLMGELPKPSYFPAGLEVGKLPIPVLETAEIAISSGSARQSWAILCSLNNSTKISVLYFLICSRTSVPATQYHPYLGIRYYLVPTRV